MRGTKEFKRVAKEVTRLIQGLSKSEWVRLVEIVNYTYKQKAAKIILDEADVKEIETCINEGLY